MPSEFAYMTSAKNLKNIMTKIQGAGAPPKFSLEFLKTLGFTSSQDRPALGVLKALGFISSDGTPTARYNEYRNAAQGSLVLADALREGWKDLFLVDTQAHNRNSSELTELFKSVSGKGESVAQKMATTFKALAEIANWDSPATVTADSTVPNDAGLPAGVLPSQTSSVGLSLHHDIHLHLPATSDVAVYTAIFRALKAELSD